MKIIKTKELSQDLIKDLLRSSFLRLNAQVTDEDLEQFSKVLQREIAEISDVKDNEDYNFDLVSLMVNKAAFMFMSAGQKDTFSGDMTFAMELTQTTKNFFRNKNDRIDYQLNNFLDGISFASKEEFRQESYKMSFNASIELRDRYLLQTSADDDFDTLYIEILKRLEKLMSKDDLNILKNAVRASESRFANNPYKFIAPAKQSIKSNDDVEKLLDSDVLKYGLNPAPNRPYFYKTKYDSHDMIALKDLYLVLKEEKRLDKFAMGIGFFSKYIPELEETGYTGIFVHVEDGLVKSLQLIEKKDTDKYAFYSPMKATNALLKIKPKIDKEITELDDFYIVTKGLIGTPKMEEFNLINESLIFAYNKTEVVEVFNYALKKSEHSKNSDLILTQTRLHITPLNYNDFHIIHQHGGVIYGSNSCIFSSTPSDLLNSLISEEDVESHSKKLKFSFFDLQSKKQDYKELAVTDPSYIASSRAYIKENKLDSFKLNGYFDKKSVIRDTLTSKFTPSKFTVDLICQKMDEKRKIFKDISKTSISLLERFSMYTLIEENDFPHDRYGYFKNEMEHILNLLILRGNLTAALRFDGKDDDGLKKIEDILKGIDLEEK